MADGLRVLRDFADGVLFETAEVTKERGVILSEALARRTPALALMNARREFVLAGTLVPVRSPIGTDAAIKAARSAALRAFYDAWYRPERMTIAVVGDIDAEALAPQLEAAFATLAARGPARPEPTLDSPVLPPGISARFNPELRDGVQVELGSVRSERPPPDTTAQRRKSLSLNLAVSMIGLRLQRLAQSSDRPLNNHLARNGYIFGAYREFSLLVAGGTTQWRKAVAVAEQELRRAEEHGFDEGELDAVKESRRIELNSQATSVATATSTTISDFWVAQFQQGRVFATPDESLARVLENLDEITADECRTALREAWATGPRYLFVSAAPKLMSPSSGEIIEAYEASRAVKLAPPEPPPTVEFAYADFGPAGVVARKEHVADLDVWLVRFANGVRLNLKRTDHERGNVRLRVRFGSGRVAEPADQPGLALWAAGLIAGGLGRHDHDDIRQVLRRGNIRVSSGNGDEASTFTGSAPRDRLPMLMRLVTAYFTDAAFRPQGDRDRQGAHSTLYSSMRQSANGVFQQQILPYLAGGDPRVGLPLRDVLESHSMEALAVWLKPQLEAGPIEVAMVGDLDVEQAIAEAAKTFGALPMRAPRVESPTLRPLTFPTPPKSLSYVYPLANGPTRLILDWPVREVLTAAQRRHLQLLAEIVEDRLRVRIREEKGQTYSPSATFAWSTTYPGFSGLRCQLDVKASSGKKLMAQVAELVVDIGRKGVTTEELQRAKAPALANARQQAMDNGYWLVAVLGDAQEHPWRLDDARTLEHDTASATKAEIDALAARYLTEKNHFRFLVEARPPKS